jgi:hypothetical protein
LGHNPFGLVGGNGKTSLRKKKIESGISRQDHWLPNGKAQNPKVEKSNSKTHLLNRQFDIITAKATQA